MRLMDRKAFDARSTHGAPAPMRRMAQRGYRGVCAHTAPAIRFTFWSERKTQC